jgi:hypothetical protein
MGKQYNKDQKRNRRNAYIERKKAGVKAKRNPASAKAAAKA